MSIEKPSKIETAFFVINSNLNKIIFYSSQEFCPKANS